MYNHFKSNKVHEKGQGLVEYALILVLVAIVVIAAMMILGPTVGNVFNNVNSSLEGLTSGGGGGSLPSGPSSNTAYDNYTGIPRMGNTYAIEYFCNTAGSGAAYNSYSVGSGWDITAGPNVSPSTINGGSNTLITSGTCP
jgi:pilus assembly protein Flp/PilA